MDEELESQIQRLADAIKREFPGESFEPHLTVDVAIRLLRKRSAALTLDPLKIANSADRESQVQRLADVIMHEAPPDVALDVAARLVRDRSALQLASLQDLLEEVRDRGVDADFIAKYGDEMGIEAQYFLHKLGYCGHRLDVAVPCRIVGVKAG